MRTVIGCIPAREADRLGFRVDIHPANDYREILCDGCHKIPILIGKRGRAVRAATGAAALCPRCIAAIAGVDFDVQSLGGK